jgi:CheY-like chemotaxis protein
MAPDSEASPGTAAAPGPRVLVVDTDRVLCGLIEEWLGGCGCECSVLAQDADDGPVQEADVVVVDVPFPRQGGLDLLQRVASRHPGTPIVALSSTFFAGVESSGALARSLGVAAVLPKPVAREALIRAVKDLLAQSGHSIAS